MNLALFDFDGTITRKDSLLDFLKFTFGMGAVLRGIFSMALPLAGYKVGLVAGERMKEKVLTRFFKGLSPETLEQMGEKYVREALWGIIRESAVEKIREHQGKGDEVVIVTASIAQYVKPLAFELGVGLIATELEVRDGLLTGRLSGVNCSGPEKVRRIREAFDLEKFSSIYAYGDSPNDREMLAIAGFPFMKYFE